MKPIYVLLNKTSKLFISVVPSKSASLFADGYYKVVRYDDTDETIYLSNELSSKLMLKSVEYCILEEVLESNRFNYLMDARIAKGNLTKLYEIVVGDFEREVD